MTSTPFYSNTYLQLDPVDVSNYEEFLRAYIEQEAPNVDVSKGTVFYDLIIRPAAMFQTLSAVNINRFRRGLSMLEISQDPELVPAEMVDATLSNYRVTRKQGLLSGGTVTIYIASNVTTAIPSGAVFTSGLLQFVTQQAYAGVPSSSLITKTTDRLIKRVNSTTWSFDIEILAAAEGSEYQLSQGISLSLQSPPANYITTKATYDFSTGQAAETNSAMVLRLEDGISGKTVSARRNIRSLVKSYNENVLHGEIIGYGDPDMQRDHANIFEISYGGKSDIYLQTDYRPTTVVLRKTATLVSKTLSRWQVFLNRDEFAGAYQIVKILPIGSTDAGTLPIEVDTRTVNAAPLTDAPDAFIPDIQSYCQAAFSRFQEVTLEFSDTTQTTGGLTELISTREYDVTILRLPSIADLQDNLISDHWTCGHRYDDLVRAPIPCLVSLTMTIRIPLGTQVNTAAVKSGIADRVNQLGFANQLSSSVIADAVHDLIDTRAQIIMPMDMFGEVIDPATGAAVPYRSGSMLRIPADHAKSISSKTLMFFVDPADINILTETF